MRNAALDPGADVCVLRISMVLPGPGTSVEPRVALELQYRRQQLQRWEIPVTAIGVPRSFSEAASMKYYEPQFAFPVDIAGQIGASVRKLPTPDTDAVWIELASPTGTLTLVPWERILHPVTGLSFLRLPYLGVESVANLDSLDVVIVATSPVAKEAVSVDKLVPTLAQAYLDAGPNRTTVHVFTEARYVDAIRAAALPNVTVYDPNDVPADFFDTYSLVGNSPTPTDLKNDRPEVRTPWLRWITRELGQMSVDCVHFISHGYMGLERGMLALAESPIRNVDQQWARFVGPHQLVAGLADLGAWSVAIGAPTPNFSILGLRALADDLARMRNGPVMLHEMPWDFDTNPAAANDLRGALHFLYANGGTAHHATPAPPPNASTIMLSCPPSRAGSVQALEKANSALLYDTLNSFVTHSLASGEPVQSWAATVQRNLERSTAELCESRVAPDSAVRKGAEAALRLVAFALNDGVRKSGAHPVVREDSTNA